MEIIWEIAGAAARAAALRGHCHLAGGDFSESLCQNSVMWRDREREGEGEGKGERE